MKGFLNVCCQGRLRLMGKRAREQRRAATRAQQVPKPQPQTEARMYRGNNRWDALAAVEEAARLEASVTRRKDRAVIKARSTGASWTDLARVLGVSPQAVQQKYGKRGVSPGEQP